jgi:rRNA maturation endonuclease Nob1
MTPGAPELITIFGLFIIVLVFIRTAKKAKTRCPYCAELIRVEALVCKHCGHEIKHQSS